MMPRAVYQQSNAGLGGRRVVGLRHRMTILCFHTKASCARDLTGTSDRINAGFGPDAARPIKKAAPERRMSLYVQSKVSGGVVPALVFAGAHQKRTKKDARNPTLPHRRIVAPGAANRLCRLYRFRG